MWSVKYTGYQGVVKDSYQRICLRMPATEFLDANMFKKVEELVSTCLLRHILLEIDLKDSTLDYLKLEDQCCILRDLTLPEEKLVFSCEVANYERDNTAINDVMKYIKPCVVLLKRIANRNKTLTMMKYLILDTERLEEEALQANEAQSQVRTPPVCLGASCLDDEERQYVLDAQRGVIRAMCLGPVSFPNLSSCTIDLLHTRECNAFLTIDTVEDGDHFKGLAQFSKIYKKPAAVILTKALLELGAIVCIDSKLVDSDTFRYGILRICHPFSHVQVEKAPTDRFSFILRRKELELLVEKSEEVELEEELRLIAGPYTLMPDIRHMGV